VSQPKHYLRKPTVIEAIRYGKEDDGRWYPGAVQMVAAFLLGKDIDAELDEAQIVEVVQPTGAWSPSEGESSLLMWDSRAHGAWLPLAQGDWVIKGVQGEFYPCKPDIFAATYEPVTA
jgi:hypothetical protein